MTARRVALAASALLVAIALSFLRPLATPGPALRDFEAYYAAGATWQAGGNPYSPEIWNVERTVPGVVATRDELLPFVGPPFTLPFWALLAALGFAHASFVWTIVLLAAALTLVIAVLRVAGVRDPVGIAAVCLFAAAFGPLTSAVALGQVALVASAGVVLAAMALQARRVFAAIGATILAATQPNIALALTERLMDWRTWLALGVGAGLALAGSIAAIGFLPFGRYLQLLEAHANAERSLAIQVTVPGVSFGLGASPGAAQIIGDVVGVVVVLITAFVIRDRRFSSIDRVAIACAALPLVVPFAHEHDLTIVLFPAVLVLRRARRGWWPLAAAASVAVAIDWLGLAQRPSGIAQCTALALAAALAATVLSRGRRGFGLVAPFAVAVAVLVAGFAAAKHPVPVWPDALGSGFHVADARDAPTVWHAEQVAAGLAAPNLTATLLRSASIAGCACLWAVALIALRRPAEDPSAEAA
jgi:hypothetical protein